jgi:lipopolysaccharide transport system permease protein
MEQNATGERSSSTVLSLDTRVPEGSQERGKAASETIVIEPTRGWMSLRLGEVWEYRELLYFFVWRDVKVRYKQTALGALWVIVQPLTMMAIFTLLLGRLAGLGSDTPGNVPYSVLVFAGLVPWTLFSSSLNASAQSLVGSANLVTKVYFPRLILPAASLGSYLIDFALSTTVLLLLMGYDGIYPTWRIVAFPAIGLATLVSAGGVGTWLTALNVRYRDIRYLVPFLTQIWLFASPVAYSTTRIPERYRVVYDLNPMAGIAEGFRWSLLGTPWGLGWLPALSFVVSVGILVSGAFFFRRVERTFADEM